MKLLQGRALRTAAAAAVFTVIAVPGMAQDSGSVSDIPSDLGADLQNSYIFVFNDKKVRKVDVPGRAHGLANRHGGTVENVYSNVVRGFSARMSAADAARLARQNRDIAFYEADQVVWAAGERRRPNMGKRRRPNTVLGNVSRRSNPSAILRANGKLQVAKKPTVDNSGPRQETSNVRRVGGPVDGTGLTAWVLDTGIDLDHPDLIVDIGRSRKFAGGRNAGDRNGHGTHVAGIIGALDNEIDVIGVAAGATLVSVRVLRRNGLGRTSGVIKGVDYVTENAAPGDVVNMSLIGGASDALDAAVIRAANRGILFAVAAGNDGADAAGYSPARVNHPNVYTVSAINGNDHFASFSNWGSKTVDIAAPGVNILSSAIDGGTMIMSGTSMATPHVAGVLLATGGWPREDGCAAGDPDGNPDPIAHIYGGAFC